jgi:hypothetical protein
MPREPIPIRPCALCERPFPADRLTRHHCKPRAKGGTADDVEMVCSQCHGMVHATFTNNTLAALYQTIEQLRLAPELGPFLRWVRKQSPSRRKKDKERRRKV